MSDPKRPLSVDAAAVPPRARPSSYPAHLVARMAGREKRTLGDLFGLRAFGVNLTRLAPGAWSALHHQHTRQEEFLYVLEGEATVVTAAGVAVLPAGHCAGFTPAGGAHHVENRSARDVVYLEVGDRPADDAASYPDDDLKAEFGANGQWRYTRKDGTPL